VDLKHPISFFKLKSVLLRGKTRTTGVNGNLQKLNGEKGIWGKINRIEKKNI
jgi:hypothetical protein